MEPFKCYVCKATFDEARDVGEYAICPFCGSMDIVDNVPRKERGQDSYASSEEEHTRTYHESVNNYCAREGKKLVQIGWKSDGQTAGGSK